MIWSDFPLKSTMSNFMSNFGLVWINNRQKCDKINNFSPNSKPFNC